MGSSLLKMNEDFLQFVWKHKLYDLHNMVLSDGRKFDVLDAGALNRDSGPDFFNAKIKIDGTVWVGNVEVHYESSQWYGHHHHLDKAYDNVILHVVFHHNKDVYDVSGSPIPVFEMIIPDTVLENYHKLLSEAVWPACKQDLRQIDIEAMKLWLNAVAIERLQSKTDDVKRLYMHNNGSWEAVWLQMLGAVMGFRVNKEAFVMLMQRTPFKVIIKESYDVFRIEALLFGQAGLLPEHAEDQYSAALNSEYQFLKHKYELTPMPGYIWKFARMRPGNFPTLRIAQFAAIIYKHPAMVAELLKQQTTGDINSFFDIEVSDYWKTHYRFSASSKPFSGKLGKSAIDLLMINVVAPFVFFYGSYHELPDVSERALDWLSAASPENNYITRGWAQAGIVADNAMQSQALIQLREKYCLRYRCVHCYAGSKLIAGKSI